MKIKLVQTVLLIVFVILIPYKGFSQVTQNTESQSENVTMKPIPDDPDCKEDQKFVWYYDYDGDGHGVKTPTVRACSKPDGYAGNYGDCDDDSYDPENTMNLYYFDGDGDGYGDAHITQLTCLPSPRYVSNNLDCNDTIGTVNIDKLWYQDTNGDGVISDLDGAPIMSCSKPGPNYSDTMFGDTSNHWIHGFSYDSKGNVTGASRTYFDDLGKPNVSLSKDYVVNKIWGTETTYDNFGRPDKSSFIAPSPLSTFGKANFFNTAADISASILPVNQSVGAVASSQTMHVSNTITATGPISSGLNVNFIAGNTIVLSTGFSVTGVAGSSFTATIVIPPVEVVKPNLANYYSDNNAEEPYQATATHPYSQINYDTLNPGNTINVVGGNKINGEWKTGYSYTVPAAQEMYYVYGLDYYDGPVTSNGEEVITKFYKSINIDANGVENVAFTDGEGKVLATARSGGGATYPVVSLIGTQGFVDVHIPAGITSGISLIGQSSSYTVYDLRTGAITTNLTGGNAYRIQANTVPSSDPKTYISGGRPTYGAGVLGITYNVNYYDYAVNVYNKTGQLIKSIQPNGYVASPNIPTTQVYLTSDKFTTTYAYNSLGQVIETKSSDEGTSKFAYRKDGQIRYSQSALQSNTKVSYTDYDTYGRPIESGVVATTWETAIANPDGALVEGTRTEQTITVYDYAENNTAPRLLPDHFSLNALLASSGIPATNYIQNNLSGNVAITYTKDGGSVTWYSYDVYGRLEWMVAFVNGAKANTIHYEYDYRGNVKKVIFQKDKATELFVHRYTYNVNNMLEKVETSTDSSTFITHANYSYYLTGELKRVNIAEGAQGIDYVYTLGGALKSINHPSLDPVNDPGHDTNDVFGITLDYYKGDYLRSGKNITSSPSAGADYNGNIKAVRWANKGIAQDYTGNIANQKGYLYNYNRNNWLTGAIYGNANASTADITAATSYKESGLTYDANGNIKSLQRTNDAGTVVDDLTYNYTNPLTGMLMNRLSNVNDLAVTPDLTDIENQSVGNYEYDAIGQLIRNVQEDIYYYYNTQGLVTQINKGINPMVKFSYNERGQRVKKESFTYLSSTDIKYSTDYYILDLSGNVMAIYNSYGGTTMRPGAGTFAQKDLPIFGLNRLGVYNRASATSVYEITDHLGNVRAVVQKQNGSPVIKSFADYYPFGEQLPMRNSLSNYRYAFQGQELDKETGMEAFQLRLWDGRIGRWLSPDPYGQYSSPYLGMGNNPIGMIDPDGGYSWLGARLRWALGGFEGTLTGKSSKGEYGIDYGNKSFYNSATGEGGFQTNIKFHDTKELGTPVVIIPSLGGGGMTLPTVDLRIGKNFGSFDGGAIIFAGSYDSKLLQHERGHVEQIRERGAFGYLKDVGLPSAYNGLENDFEKKLFGRISFSIPHEEFYTETDANIKAFWLYGDGFYHVERAKGIEPYNPLIGRVSKYSTIERIQIYNDMKVHHYIDIPTKK